MIPAHVELWSRLETFAFDEPGAAFTFSQRLAREHGWSAAHTGRVIDEYRRFLFLAVTAGHPVSPSDAIDQVWHLHLTYTRSYWETLCGEVLRQPFHHQPTRGGDNERAKFHDWYARTLASYRTAFETSAPADLWPPAGRPAPANVRRINVRRYWLIPRPRGPRAQVIATIVAVAALFFIAGCTGSGAFPGAGLLDLRGPQFLLFYVIAFPVALAIATLVRWWARQPASLTDNVQPEQLDPYVVAALAGGPKRVALTALARLIHANAVTVKRTGTGARISRNTPLSPKAHPIEKQLHRNLSHTCSFSEVVRQLRPASVPLDAELVSQGWLVAPAQRPLAHWLPLAIAASPIVLGLLKISVGLDRGKPVSFLVMLCLASIAIVVGIFARPLRVTRRGQAWLDRSLKDRASLRYNKSPEDPAILPLAVGLFGVGVLANTSLAHISERLTPLQDASPSFIGDSGFGFGSDSSSSSSDSGGSSCGGDSGGSSGCGGCGGGGGGD